MRRGRPLLPVLLLMSLLSCRTVGVSRMAGGFAEVVPPIAHEMILDSQSIVVLDFRSTAEFHTGHIAGALSVPLDTIETRLPELLPYRPQTVLVYADAEDESVRGAKLLVAAGFSNIVRIAGGITRWIANGYETVTSN